MKAHKHHARDASPELHAPRADPPVRIVTASVFDVIVHDSAGNVVGETTLSSLPPNPTVLALPVGPVTIPSLTTTPAIPNVQIISQPSSNPTLSQTSSPTPSLSISLTSSGSQQVLSSPPPTPLPSDSTMTLPSTTSAFPTLSAAQNSTVSASSSSSIATTGAPYLVSNSTRLTTAMRTTSSSDTTARPTYLTPSSGSERSSPTAGSSDGSGWAGGVGAAPTATGADASSPSTTETGAASPGISPTTQTAIGGAFGGLAAIALVCAVILFLIRRRKSRLRALPLQLSDSATRDAPGTSQSGAGMVENSVVPWGSRFKKFRPYSTQTTTTTDTSPSEKGFQKISGRKIESVLISHGDGYGGRGPGDGNMSGNSFYRDSMGTTFGGPGSVNSSMFVGPASKRESEYHELPATGPSRGPSGRHNPDNEIITVRPGPARTPVHSPGGPYNMSGYTTPPAAPATPRDSPSSYLRRPDPVGRSHASADYSRGSKFSETFVP